jgi:homopolymeric O-antigen transport system ATP-binding protein
MLNGIILPDKGKISIKGKVGALIEVGAGFHPMLTGRENVYVNGAILGISNMANINSSTKPCQNYTSISV